MGKTFNKINKGIAKAVGAGALVDYASSKMAKHQLKGKKEAKFVEDKTSGKKALISAVVTATTLTGGAGLARKMLTKPAKKLAGKTIGGLSDRYVRIQDKAIMDDFIRRKKK